MPRSRGVKATWELAMQASANWYEKENSSCAFQNKVFFSLLLCVMSIGSKLRGPGPKGPRVHSCLMENPLFAETKEGQTGEFHG